MVINVIVQYTIFVFLLFVISKRNYYTRLYLLVIAINQAILVLSPNFGLKYNFVGKILAISVSIYIVHQLVNKSKEFTYDELGISIGLYDFKDFILATVFITFYVSIIYVVGHFVPNEFELEGLIFHFGLSGIDEELVYRGLGLAILPLCIDTKIHVFRREVNLAFIIIGLQWTMIHALFIDPIRGIYNFSSFNFFIVGSVAVFLSYLTIKTRSILLPIVVHTLLNIGGSLVPLIPLMKWLLPR